MCFESSILYIGFHFSFVPVFVLLPLPKADEKFSKREKKQSKSNYTL